MFTLATPLSAMIKATETLLDSRIQRGEHNSHHWIVHIEKIAVPMPRPTRKVRPKFQPKQCDHVVLSRLQNLSLKSQMSPGSESKFCRSTVHLIDSQLRPQISQLSAVSKPCRSTVRLSNSQKCPHPESRPHPASGSPISKAMINNSRLRGNYNSPSIGMMSLLSNV